MLNDAPRRASRPTASRNYTPRAHPIVFDSRAPPPPRATRQSPGVTLVSSVVALRSSARLRDAVSDALCREIVRARRPRLRGRFSETGLRLGSQTSDRVPGTRGARGPATDFSSLGAREIGRGSVGAGFPDSRRRPRADVVARTSSSSSSRGASRQWKTRARRERDASATRARREPTRTDDGPRRRDRTARRDRGARAAVCV